MQCIDLPALEFLQMNKFSQSSIDQSASCRCGKPDLAPFTIPFGVSL